MEKIQLIERVLSQSNYSPIIFNEKTKDQILNPSIDFLLKKIESNPELNFDKILLISVFLLKKIEKLKIRITPRMLVLTATILWHSALLRPGDIGYFTQEYIDSLFKRSVSVARYLRQELGITEKKYNGLDDFFNILEDSIPLEVQMEIEYENISVDKYEFVKNLIAERIIGRQKARSAIETTTFLYFNEARTFSKKQIWYAIRQNFDLEGETPRASFNSDISRYTDNANVKTKRSPLLFTITNIDERKNKIQILDSTREKIDQLIKENGNSIVINLKKAFKKVNSNNNNWKCFFSSCNFHEINIARTDSTLISTSTLKEITLHLLRHLKSKYFGATDILNFLESKYDNIFTKEDKEEYSSGGIKWKVNLRNILNVLKTDSYIMTDEINQISESVNREFGTDARKYRLRRRTSRFFDEFQNEIYSDWELYSLEKEEIKEYLKKKKDIERSEKHLSKIKEKLINSHSDAQGVLLEIGNMLKFDTYVAKEDRKKSFNNTSLGEIAILGDVPAFSYKRIVDIAKHIDVIWFKAEFPSYCFEVEESTSVTKGLNRLADLGGSKASFFIVGSKEKKEKYKKEINRYSFRNIKSTTKFLDYSKLEEFYKRTLIFTNLKKEILGD